MPDDSRPDDRPAGAKPAGAKPAGAKPAGAKPRGYVPVPGLIDLDAVEADARDALWGADDASASPDAEDDTPVPNDVPEAETAPLPEPVSPEPAAASPEPAAAPPASTLVDPAPVDPTPVDPAPSPLSAEADPGTEPTSRAGSSDASAPPSTDGPTANAPTAAPDATQAPAVPPSLRPPEAVVQTAKEATKDRGRELVALVTEYGRRHLPDTAPRDREPDTGPPRLTGRLGQILPIMRLVPWVLALGFGVSFAWDFPTAEIALFDRTIPLAGLLRILSISGLIGFLTNWLAITMLFQPREKRAIIPQGLIPAQRERVIYRLSDAISRELINADIIKQKIQESGVIGRYRDLGLNVVRGVVEDPGFRADLKTLAQRYAQETLGSEAVRRELAQIAVERVEQTAGQGLGGVALRLYRTFAEDDFQRRVDNALAELPQAVTPLLDRIDHALDAVPQKVEARGDEIEEAATKAVLSFVESFDIQAMIQEKARGFDEAQLEHLLKSTSNEQLNYIKYLGGILGVLGGLVIWRVEVLVVFVVLGLALWAIDEVLVQARRARI